MKIVWFVHAIASCWNNGNAHFLRGLGTALHKLGHEIVFFEPAESWSETNLINDHGTASLETFRSRFGALQSRKYDPAHPDLDALCDGADLVIAHEWNEPALVNALGEVRRRNAGLRLLFQDTHHRAVTAPAEMGRFDLSSYDGVLAFGEVLAETYRARGWGSRVWVLHEAADTTVFFPHEAANEWDLVWIGNWGDEERSAEIREFILDPVRDLSLKAQIYGVRYPSHVIDDLTALGFAYGGWLPNHEAPLTFARSNFTVHVPRRPYANALPGIPTIRVFEALACGIPLLSAPWNDSEGLFSPGCFLFARDGNEMKQQMRAVMADSGLRVELREKGLAQIAARHTCDHRAREIMDIYSAIAPTTAREAA